MYKVFFKAFALILGITPHCVYSESTSEATPYPTFCHQAAHDDRVFSNFRRDSNFAYIVEGASYQEGLGCLKIILKQYPELTRYFSVFRSGDAYGNPITFNYKKAGRFSPTTLRYIKIAGDLKKEFGDLSQFHILEIGGGCGGQCKIISDIGGFASYTIIDIAPTNKLSSKYLELLGVKKVSFINNTDDLSHAKQYDLVISNYALSEVSREGQLYYLEHVVLPTPRGYMLWNPSCAYNTSKSKALTLNEITQILQDHGKKVTVTPENPVTGAGNMLLMWHE